MQDCVSGRVPPRLVYFWQPCSPERMIQIVFEWEAPWPCKYVIECHEGRWIVARSDRLDWETVYEFLAAAWYQSRDLSVWYALVQCRLRREGGDS